MSTAPQPVIHSMFSYETPVANGTGQPQLVTMPAKFARDDLRQFAAIHGYRRGEGVREMRITGGRHGAPLLLKVTTYSSLNNGYKFFVVGDDGHDEIAMNTEHVPLVGLLGDVISRRTPPTWTDVWAWLSGDYGIGRRITKPILLGAQALEVTELTDDWQLRTTVATLAD